MTTSNLHFQVFSKDNCKYCTMAINLLNSKDIKYTVIKLVPIKNTDNEMSIEEFKNKYPNVKTVPYIVDSSGNTYTYTSLEAHLTSLENQ